MKRTPPVLLLLGLALIIGPARAQTDTRVVVRVVSHDAKIIGSGVGGARVTVRNPATGAVVAQGIQQGGTGSTTAIVVEAVARGASIYDTPGAAAFRASLALTVPTVLEFVGEAPLGYPHAMQRAVKSLLVIPGQHIEGDGILLELHGFIVELVEARRVPPGGPALEVTARVRMLCGCPLEPEGLWDASRVGVRARVYVGDQVVEDVALRYGGEPNIFRGRVALGQLPAGARLVVVALDPTRVNFGESPALAIN